MTDTSANMMNAEMTTRQIDAEQIIDNRTITCALADAEWTRVILASCVECVDDTSDISFEGDYSGIEIEGPFDDDTLFSIQMEVINGDFWQSEGVTSAELQAGILADSGMAYPEIKEQLALVDYSEVQDALLNSTAGNYEE